MADITFTLETITPEIARTYLTFNAPRNRKIKSSAVQMLKQDILDGKWRVTHQGIAFNKEGVLIDGQHRLFAIISAGKPVDMVVARGLDDATMDIIDGGVSRSLIDRLKVAGETDNCPALGNSNIQAVIKQIYKMLFSSSSRDTAVSSAKSVEIYNRFQHVLDTIYRVCVCVQSKSSGSVKNRFMGCAVIAAMCNGVPEQTIRAFVKCIISKDIDDALTLGCNYKAALKYDHDYITRVRTDGAGANSDPRYQMANRAIYCFAKNKVNTKSAEPFSMTLEQLDWLEEKLANRGENDG